MYIQSLFNTFWHTNLWSLKYCFKVSLKFFEYLTNSFLFRSRPCREKIVTLYSNKDVKFIHFTIMTFLGKDDFDILQIFPPEVVPLHVTTNETQKSTFADHTKP